MMLNECWLKTMTITSALACVAGPFRVVWELRVLVLATMAI